MKKTFVCLLLLFSVGYAHAQKRKWSSEIPFRQGAFVLHGGIGFLSPYYVSGARMMIPPLFAGAEYGLLDVIGLGFSVGYSTSKLDDAGIEVKYTYMVPQLKVNFHMLRSKGFDVYAGIGAGYAIAATTYSTDSPLLAGVPYVPISSGGLAPSIYLGARYYIKDFIGFYAEAGYTMAIVSGGLVFRLQ